MIKALNLRDFTKILKRRFISKAKLQSHTKTNVLTNDLHLSINKHQRSIQFKATT